MKTWQTRALRLVVHVGAWIPLLVIIVDAFTNRLGIEPIREIILRTGKTALVLLVLSLACTPLNTVLSFRQALLVRRALGVYAFGYAALHLFVFVGVDYAFDLSLLQDAIFEKPYALVGLAAFLILLPLAFTSTKSSMKRLGQVWKKIHRGVYLAVLLAVVHFIWLVKLDIREPLVYGAITIVLLILRWSPIRQRINRVRNRPRKTVTTES